MRNDQRQDWRRRDRRQADELRPVVVRPGFLKTAPGSVLISAGETMVLCTASLAGELPRWMPKESTKGWVTAEYRMLPGSTSPRSPRSDRPDGRATEIQRLIGRSLRAVVDLEKLGPRTATVDCDVLQADGGTRTLSITGAYIALAIAFRTLFPRSESRSESCPESGLESWPFTDSVAATSVGIVNGTPLLDLCYEEDIDAEVDMNLVLTGSGRFIEIQGTGEESTFSETELHSMLALGRKGISELTRLQNSILESH
ncbi:MAG TPA: ribonuclease PH [Planctomycetaceae bacterium]|nr:ribonuclease PH [Planctomycetaceae bacterium]